MKVITEKGISYCTDCHTIVVWAQRKTGPKSGFLVRR